MADFFSDPTLWYTILGVLVAGGLGAGGWAWRRGAKTKDKEPTSPASPGEEATENQPGGSPGEPDQDEAAAQSSPASPQATLPPEAALPQSEQPQTEQPEAVESRLVRLRSRLARSGTMGKTLLSVLSRKDLSATDWEEIEDTLLLADLGIGPTDELMEKLRTSQKVAGTTDVEQIRNGLREELLNLVDPTLDRSLQLTGKVDEETGQKLPGVVLMVGVNGSGKTTTVGKLARLLVAQGHQVLLGAADTFRAAAAEQLQTWGERVGVETVRSYQENADPASVAFEAVKTAKEKQADVVLVDTAGRLQNKAGLMDELGKIRRVIEKQAPITESLLVLDATTGQNALSQAKVFAEVAGITGIVLTKLDGSAKGGIVVAVQRELGVPVKLVGLGEGADDLAPFAPENFVDAIVSGE